MIAFLVGIFVGVLGTLAVEYGFKVLSETGDGQVYDEPGIDD
jgi:hypothetical protein